MRVYLGSDHGGFGQKERLLAAVAALGHEAIDCGTYTAESTDYPDFAIAVGRHVQAHPDARGILLCRSGEGMEMAANKVKGVRAALVWKKEVAEETRRDNDANVLVLPSDFVSDEEAEKIAAAFLSTPFSGEDRHVRRLEKLHGIEGGRYAG